jgi:HD-like signal output (HDOD) protein
MRILFADDHPMNVADLRRLAKGLGQEWESEIAEGGTQALAALEKECFDVVVSELAMSDMNGVQLLKKVKELCPGSVRMVLSEQADRELVLQVSKYAHQILAKPIEPIAFNKIVENSLGLRKILDNQEMHERLASVESLPSPPRIYNELVSELQSETSSMQNIADLVGQDVSITAKILQLVNSAYFGLPTHIESPQHAVSLLGLDTLQSLVLAVGVFDQFEDPKFPGFSIDSIYDHSMAVGANARNLANCLGLQKRQSEDSLMAGMLHDVGKLVLLKHFQPELKKALELASEKSIPLHEAEKEVLGVTHAEIGAHLLSLWGLQDSILEAVALHPSPKNAASPMVNALTAVHIAYALDQDSDSRTGDNDQSALDMQYLEELDISGQLKFFRRLCEIEKTEEKNTTPA